MNQTLTSPDGSEVSGRRSQQPRARLPTVIQDIEALKPGLAFVDRWGTAVPGHVAFEMNVRPETRLLIKTLWLEGEPSVTYMRGGKDIRYRFTVPAFRWRAVSDYLDTLPYRPRTYPPRALDV